MLKSSVLTVVAGFMFGTFGLTVQADEKIPVDKLPPAVVKAVHAKFPGAKIEEAEKEVEDGRTIYEVEFDHKGSEYTVSLKEDGTIEEIEREIAEKDLPAAVSATLKAQFPHAKLKEIEEVTKGHGEAVTFEVQVVEKGKKTLELVLDAQGKILEKKDAEKDEDNDKDEKKVAIDKLPPMVVKSINEHYPKAKIEEAEKEVENGQTVYEVEIDHLGRDYSLTLKEDGTIVEIERELAENELPAIIAAALKTEFPHAKFKEIEEVTKGPGEAVTFEVQVVQKGKKTLEVVLDAQGKILEKKDAEEDDDDKDKDDKKD